MSSDKGAYSKGVKRVSVDLNNAFDVSRQIIEIACQHVKNGIDEKKAVRESYDPWIEELEGVGWIDNELGFLDQLREQPQRGRRIRHSVYSHMKTIEDCRELIEDRGIDYARQALAFCQHGGTGIPKLFELRATCDPVQIKTFLDGLKV